MIQPKYATAFLSHSSVDKKLVRRVATALGRCGVVPWMDVISLRRGAGQRAHLQRAARECVTTVLFLSKEAVESAWVDDELRAVLSTNPERILLATNSDPTDRSLIPDVLWPHVKHPERDDVDHNMIVNAEWGTPGEVARQIASHVYHGVGVPAAPEINLLIDHRLDSGRRVGLPPAVIVPANFGQRPTLVFRHNTGKRSGKELLLGRSWQRYQMDLRSAVGSAFGMIHARGRPHVHIAGGMQCSLAFCLGMQFRRSGGISISAYSRLRSDEVFDNRDQDFGTFLKGGDAGCWQQHDDFAPDPVSGTPDRIDLFVGNAMRASQAAAYRRATASTAVPVWVPSDELKDSKEVLTRVADIVRLVLSLGSPEICLFTTLPAHALPILAANLDRVAGGEAVTFMEFTHGPSQAGAERLYFPLRCPFGI